VSQSFWMSRATVGICWVLCNDRVVKTARHRLIPIAALVTAAGFTFAAPAHADSNAQQDCTAKEWPQPLLNAVGRQLEDIVNDDSFWICLNVVAIGPDGHNVLDDNSGYTQSWRITGQSPEEGTLVAENETVTVNVSR
jgi:hypothetical protein